MFSYLDFLELLAGLPVVIGSGFFAWRFYNRFVTLLHDRFPGEWNLQGRPSRIGAPFADEKDLCFCAGPRRRFSLIRFLFATPGPIRKDREGLMYLRGFRWLAAVFVISFALLSAAVGEPPPPEWWRR